MLQQLIALRGLLEVRLVCIFYVPRRPTSQRVHTTIQQSFLQQYNTMQLMLLEYNTIIVATIDCIVRIVGSQFGVYFLRPTVSHIPACPHHNSAIIVAAMQYNALNIAAIQYNHCCSNCLYCKDCWKSVWCVFSTSQDVPRPSASTPQFSNHSCSNTIQCN